jgi:membrane peptidoglycan carboxypeptidase
VRLTAVAAILLFAVLATSGAAWALTPDVGDAKDRSVAIAKSHGVAFFDAALPPKFEAALLATEDNHFYTHHGVDARGLFRAGRMIVTGGNDAGGSTLDQQLAKQLYSNGQNATSSQKLSQLVLAVKLDSRWSKTDILQMYATVVYFGGGYYGLRAASNGYFGVEPNGLSWARAALLAGLMQAPSAYDPYQHKDLAISRQQHVIDRLVATGRISAAEAATAKAEKLTFRKQRAS